MHTRTEIAHLTSVHPRFDIRIFLKQCRSLASSGYHVALIVADGKGDEYKDNIWIIDVGRPLGRLERIIKRTRLIYQKALALDAEVYHLHDPELIPIGLKLKHQGKKVIFDSHEDFPKQILGKPYLFKPARWIISKALSLYERWACRRFDEIITATPTICNKFIQINPNTVDINNYPFQDELITNQSAETIRPEVSYVGGISRIRGISEVIQAINFTIPQVRLNLCGNFSDISLKEDMTKCPGWERVNYHGFIDRVGIKDVLARSLAGLVTFHPLPNHIDAQPNKLFEYMSAGVPVIASNFPLWREIVEGYQCGLCVDPLSSSEIAEAIDYLAKHPVEAKEMGENGRRAVIEHYNWHVEEEKLLSLYQSILINRI